MHDRRSAEEAVFGATGALADAYAAVDWTATALGTPGDWSPTLRAALALVARTQLPAVLAWGEDLVLLYNAAYVDLIADKHPAALGTPAHDVFPEAWHLIGPLFAHVMDGGEATWVEDAAVPLYRRGRLEEAYFTFSYSPVVDEHGVVEGVLDLAVETTDRVIDRRRLQLLNELRELVGTVEHASELRHRTIALLGTAPEDFPLVELQLEGAENPRASVGLPSGPAGALGGRDLVVEETAAGRVAWLHVGSATERGAPQLLAVALSERLAEDAVYLDFLRLIAFTLGQGIARLLAREAERHVALTERELSETLQRNLLTRPIGAAGLDVAARYVPAAEQAQVGGDWYDTFCLPDGSLAAVIGDVAGHDRLAAAAMAQIRSLLRGVALSHADDEPAATLSRLDRVLQALPDDIVASAILARLTPEDGGTALRFSNAGHLPPVLIAPDGTTSMLERPSHVLLGVADVERVTHRMALAPGSMLVLFTDGLVERRGVHLDDSYAWLLDRLAGCQERTPDEVCDSLTADLQGVEDDVALLVLRVAA